MANWFLPFVTGVGSGYIGARSDAMAMKRDDEREAYKRQRYEDEIARDDKNRADDRLFSRLSDIRAELSNPRNREHAASAAVAYNELAGQIGQPLIDPRPYLEMGDRNEAQAFGQFVTNIGKYPTAEAAERVGRQAFGDKRFGELMGQQQGAIGAQPQAPQPFNPSMMFQPQAPQTAPQMPGQRVPVNEILYGIGGGGFGGPGPLSAPPEPAVNRARAAAGMPPVETSLGDWFNKSPEQREYRGGLFGKAIQGSNALLGGDAIQSGVSWIDKGGQTPDFGAFQSPIKEQMAEAKRDRDLATVGYTGARTEATLRGVDQKDRDLDIRTANLERLSRNDARMDKYRSAMVEAAQGRNAIAARNADANMIRAQREPSAPDAAARYWRLYNEAKLNGDDDIAAEFAGMARALSPTEAKPQGGAAKPQPPGAKPGGGADEALVRRAASDPEMQADLNALARANAQLKVANPKAYYSKLAQAIRKAGYR